MTPRITIASGRVVDALRSVVQKHDASWGSSEAAHSPSAAIAGWFEVHRALDELVDEILKAIEEAKP